MKTLFLCIVSLLFVSCAGMDISAASKPQIGGGVVAGAAAVKTVERIKEVFTPEYPLYLQPIELCTLDREVTCFLVPCQKNCVITLSFEEFVELNPKVATIRTSSKQINAAQAFCEKNKEACVDQISQYEGKTIVVEVLKD